MMEEKKKKKKEKKKEKKRKKSFHIRTRYEFRGMFEKGSSSSKEIGYYVLGLGKGNICGQSF